MSLLPAQHAHCPTANVFVSGKGTVRTHNKTYRTVSSDTSSVVAGHPVLCLHVTVRAALVHDWQCGGYVYASGASMWGCAVL